MAKKLLIVESPAKAKTIEKYLGGDFIVKSSYGHIRDLDKGKKGVVIEDKFQPHYIVSPEKQKVVKELKTASKKASEVWLATDEDREGEAISWHLCEVLGLDEATTKRIVFREITKGAIQEAVKTPRTVDKNLVDAQQARRILDRLVGFELSEVLWRKVRNKLSAGRVQSVAVKIIVDKEREITAFERTAYFKVTALFDVKAANGRVAELKAELKSRLESIESATEFVNSCNGAKFSIDDIIVKPLKRKPAPPFTTSTLQQEASRKIGFAVRRTMSAAQKLYEQGHITYMRTDSISLSKTAMDGIEKEIISSYGENYSNPRVFKTKKKDAQEAHEAIRPTRFENHTVGGDSDAVKLYGLIWKRAVASQMSEALIEKTTVKIGIDTRPSDQLQAEGEVIKFDGFLKVYMESKDDDDDSTSKSMLPPLTEGQLLDLNILKAAERYTRPPARYTEASLVKKMEELGIGRPSTYAPTITKIMDPNRGYVTKESREGELVNSRIVTLSNNTVEEKTIQETIGSTSNRLYGSDLGKVVSDFLSQHFSEVMDYSFTASIEAKLDNVANGTEQWKEMLGQFYHPFHKDVEETLEHAERGNGRRDLGTDPETGHTVMVQMLRYGPVVQIGTREEVGEEGKPKFASLRPGQNLETIDYATAMDLFKLPKALGEYDGLPVLVGIGRFGPYVKHGDAFISMGRGVEPLDVTFDQAVEFIEIKRKEDAPVATFKGEPVTQGKGRFGPFLKYKSFFVNIPKRIDPDNITQEEMFELIEKKLEKEANRYIKHWESEKISVENARWGPVIKFKKKVIKLPRKKDGEKMAPEDLVDIELDQVKKWIELEIPGAFKKKAPAKKKKAAAKKK